MAAKLLTSVLALAILASSSAIPKRQSNKVGYFFTSFRVNDEAIYMHLSDGNNPHRYRRASNKGSSDQAVLRSNVGSKGVRDSHIVRAIDGSKYWMTATDLNANAFNNDFNEASRFGSRSMVIWESTDLANWSAPRLTQPLLNSTAGNFWAPESNWDPLLNAYVTVFSARFWSDADPNRTGRQPPNVLMYITTTDFETFSEARDYVRPGDPVIDATFHHAPEEGPDVWYRFVKSEIDYKIFQQRSTDGILGTWTNVGNAPDTERIEFAKQYANNEGALIFRDNLDSSLYHLWIDENTLESYIPGQARTLHDMAAWEAVSLDGFPTSVKHGVVVPVTQAQYDAIEAKYDFVHV